MKQKGLGRGLGAFIDESIQFEQEDKAVNTVPIQKIDVFENQPRKFFDFDKLEELAESIKKHGVIQPLILKRIDDRYMIIAGERRYRAARLAGLKELPAIFMDVDEKETLEISIIENIQREDLNPIEEAQAMEMLMKNHGLTQEEVSERLGRSRSAIANTLRLLALPEDVRQMVSQGLLTAGHARTLIALKSDREIRDCAAVVIKNHLSVRETEKLVKKMQEQDDKENKKQEQKRKNPDLLHAERQLSEALETKVSILGNEGKGKVVLEYYSKDQLDSLYALLIGK